MKTVAKLIFAATCTCLMLGGLSCWARAAAHAHGNGNIANSQPGYLGVNVRAVDRQTAAELKMPSPQGTEIVNVDRDAPAGKVGLRAHDVILAVNGQPVSNGAELGHILQGTSAGQTIHLRIYREGKVQEVPVQLASRAQVAAEAWPEGSIFVDGLSEVQMPPDVIPMPFPRDFGPNVNLHEFAMLGSDGLDVEPLSRQLADFFGAPKGMGLLVRDVAPNSPAASAGLKAGDVITAANGLPAATLRAWLMIVSQNQGKPVQLRIIRNHRMQTIRYTPGGHGRQGELTTPGFGVPWPGIPPEILEEVRDMAPELEHTMLALEQMQPLLMEQDEVLRADCLPAEEIN